MPPLSSLSKSCLALAIGQALVTPVQAADIVVNSISDTSLPGAGCTLREAITSAQTNPGNSTSGCVSGDASGLDVITFELPDASLRTITLTNSLPTITSRMAIIGPSDRGITINANNTGRVFSIDNASVIISHLTITGGSAIEGGGISVLNESSVSISHSTISGNVAEDGGAIDARRSNLAIFNSTLSGNNTMYGGGVFADGSSVSLQNSTVSENSSSFRGGGLFAINSSNVSLKNTLIAGNSANIGSEVDDITGDSTFSTDHNLFGDDSHTSGEAFGAFFTPGATDITATSDGTQPTYLSYVLKPLDNNGGATRTHALPVGSPAIDSANNSVCLASPVNGVDQRERPRASIIPVCDIGAFERFTPQATIIVNTTLGSLDPVDCSLFDAIRSSNSAKAFGGCVAGGDVESVIEFDSDVFPPASINSISLSELLPEIRSSLTINGPSSASLTINANNIGRVFGINDANVNINNLIITGGSSNFGGGIYAIGASSVTLSNSTVTGNSGSASGGGIYSGGSTGLTLRASTVSGNSAAYGAGVFSTSSSNTILSNSTVSGNTASSGGGGVFAAYSSGTLSLSNSTVAANSAGSYGGGIASVSSTVKLGNSIVGGNLSDTDAEIYDRSNSSTFITDQINLLGDASHTNAQAFSSSFIPDADDITATSDGVRPTALSAILEQLGDNGGVTQTHALATGSPAIDAADYPGCIDTPVNDRDQRGQPRSNADFVCDIGPFEVTPIATIAVDTMYDTAGSEKCSLRDAIQSSNTGDVFGGCAPGGDIASIIVFDPIVFPTASTNTITLSSPLPVISSDMTFSGEGVEGMTIDGNGYRSMFRILESTVNIISLTLVGGSESIGGGAIVARESNINISDTTVTANTASRGGGIRVFDSSNLSLLNSTVTGNTATGNGGGIIATDSSVTLSNSTVSLNSASGDGGGVYVRDSVLGLSDSSVSENAAASGGGIYGRASSVTIRNSRVFANLATYDGGGIHSYGSETLTLENSTVAENSAVNFGGGIRAGYLSLSNSTISGNSAIEGGGILIDGFIRGGVVTMRNSTVSDNSASSFGGGLRARFSSEANFYNTIIAGNFAATGAEISDLNGDTVFTNSHNLFGDDSRANAQAFDIVGNIFMPSATDIVATSDGTLTTVLSSILRPLADNGGPSETHALVENSPAIDAADDAICIAPPIDSIDQRGIVRPIGDACDIGSYEAQDESSFFVVPLPGGKSVIFSL